MPGNRASDIDALPIFEDIAPADAAEEEEGWSLPEADEEGESPLFEMILTHPESPRQWLWDVGLGGLLQAAAIRLVGCFLPVFIMLFFPLLMIVPDELFGRFFTLLGTYVIGSIAAGHLYPHFAFWRSGVAFVCAALFEILLLASVAPALQVPLDRAIYLFLLMSIFGAMVSAAAGALGARAKRDFNLWIRSEIQEFRRSVDHHTGISGRRFRKPHPVSRAEKTS